jgi:hypothetical protein
MPYTKPTNPEDVSDRNVQALEIIKASGILNPHITLDKIMELTQKVSQIPGGPQDLRHTDTFIHSHFIFTHTEE